MFAEIFFLREYERFKSLIILLSMTNWEGGTCRGQLASSHCLGETNDVYRYMKEMSDSQYCSSSVFWCQMVRLKHLQTLISKNFKLTRLVMFLDKHVTFMQFILLRNLQKRLYFLIWNALPCERKYWEWFYLSPQRFHF